MTTNSSVALPTVLCAPTFVKDYRRASPLLRQRALRAARDLVSHFEGTKRFADKELKPIEGVETRYKAFRLRLSSGARMICARIGPIVLYRFGSDHELTKWASANQDSLFRDQQASRLSPLAEVVGEQTLIDCAIDTELEERYDHSLDGRWVYQLDDEQDAVACSILGDLERFCADGRTRTHWILGGPGTGKTAILASLLDLLRSDQRFELVIRWPVQVVLQSIAGLQYSVVKHMKADEDLGGTKRRVMLIDDPSTLKRALQHHTEATDARGQFHVCAFDPLQLAVRSTDKAFEKETSKRGIVIHELHTSYRQRRRVALTAMKIAKALERSTPFLNQEKIEKRRVERRWQSELANELHFPNPASTTLTVDVSDYTDAASQIVSALPSKRKCWKHWPPFLFVYADELKAEFEELKCAISKIRALSFIRMPSRFHPEHSSVSTVFDALRDETDQTTESKFILGGENSAWEVPLSSTELIKGLEFQAAVVLIRRTELDAVSHGFKGSGERVSAARELLRIPVSRARDALIFASI